MLRSLSFVTVRQQHDEAAHAQPFGLAGTQELVDDDLRAIGKIAELRLPQHQGARIGEAVAVFEADDGGFGKRAVDDLEWRLPRTDMVDRDIACFGLLVDQYGVAL